MGLRQRVVCYACQVAVFLTENCSLFFYFFATEGFYRKTQKLPDLVDFQGFVCYNILNKFVYNVLNTLIYNKRRKAPYFLERSCL